MSRRGAILFAAMCVIWGIPYLLIKVAVDDLSAVEIVFGRSALAVLVLLPIAVRAGSVRPALRAWRPLMLYGVLEMAGPWLLLSHAEKELSSSLTGLLVAATPLVSAVAVRLIGDEDRLDRSRLLGLVIGIVGVGVLLGLDVRGDLLSVAAVGLVVIGYATGPLVITRRLADVPASGVNALALAMTALLYLPFAIPAAASRGAPPLDATLAVVGLGLICTALALMTFFLLIAEVGSQRALVITFVNPAVAVALGIVVLDEAFTRGTAIGFPLVLIGCVLATRRSRQAAPDARSAVGHEAPAR